MSKEAGSWESVKGFCRRKTQKIKHSTGVAGYSTKDEEFDQKVMKFEKLHETSKAIIEKLASLEFHIMGTMSTIADLGQLFQAAGAAIGSESVTLQGKQVDMFAKSTVTKIEPLHAVFYQATAELQKYANEGEKLPQLLDDRKDKLLELDFFINKTNELKAHPPSDQTRIPRNESCIADWKHKYDDVTERITNFVNSWGSGLGNGVVSAVTAVVTDYGKAVEEIGRFSKATLTGPGKGKSTTVEASF